MDGTQADFGHQPVIGPRIVRNVPRLDQELLDRFAVAYAPDVSDAVGELYTMSAEIGPLYRPVRRIVGQALTVKAPPGDNLTVHGALGLIQPGDVLVIDWRATTAAAVPVRDHSSSRSPAAWPASSWMAAGGTSASCAV